MIIGNGDIANVLPNRNDLLFFASGVSNSNEIRESEYQREKDLLMQQNKDQHIVYFSSLAALNGHTRYLRHKVEMEELIKNNFKRYTIVRLGNISWGSNPYTFLNFIRNKIKNNESFEIKDEYRYIVDKDEFLFWVNKIPFISRNVEMSVIGKRMKVKDIIDEYGYIGFYNKKE